MLLDANPLEDIAAIRRSHAVVANGPVFLQPCRAAALLAGSRFSRELAC